MKLFILIICPILMGISLRELNEACQMTVKIATPPMYKTDSTLTAMLIIKDGTPPYTYAWNNGSTHDTAIYSKEAFDIICNVSDSKGCVVHDVLILGE